MGLLTCSRHRTLQNIRIPILQIFFFCLLKGDEKTFPLVQKIFSTNKNVFLSPFNKQKQRFGELEFEYFGGSDVVNKLQNRFSFENQNIKQMSLLKGILTYTLKINKLISVNKRQDSQFIDWIFDLTVNKVKICRQISF